MSQSPGPNCWQGQSSVLGSCNRVYRLHPSVTFKVLFFWGSSWRRLRHWLNYVALERGLGFPISSAQPVPPSPPPAESFGQPVLLSSVRQGDQSAVQTWDFWSVSPWEAFVQESDGRVLGCMTISQGRDTPISPVSSAHATARRGRSTHPPPTGL